MSFSWVPIYEELTNYLIQFKDNSLQLVGIIKEMQKEGLKTISIMDIDVQGNKIELKEIDPFSFFANFNRGGEENRTEILKYLKEKFNLKSDIPIDFDGIPVVNPMNSRFFGWEKDRDVDEINNIWKLFVSAVSGNIDESAFNYCLNISGVKRMITIGLFWAQPKIYLPLDRRTAQYLNISKDLLKEVKLKEYQTILEQVKGQSPCEISYKAYIADISSSDEEDAVDEPLFDENKKNYWIIAPGKRAEKWEEFYEDKIIAIGWELAQFGDISKYTSKDDIAKRIKETYKKDHKGAANTCHNFAFKIKKGDIVFAKKGLWKVVGYGVVKSDYIYDDKRTDFKHIREVDWQKKGNWDLRDNPLLPDFVQFGMNTMSLIRDDEFASRIEQIILNSEAIEEDSDISPERQGDYLKTAIDLLVENNGSISFTALFDEMQKRLRITDIEKSVYEKSGAVKWETIFKFKTIGLVKGGYISKESRQWSLTQKGYELKSMSGLDLLELTKKSYYDWVDVKGESESVEDEDQIVPFNISEYLNSAKLDNLKFTPHILDNPERIKVNQILERVSKNAWMLPKFQRYFDWDRKDVKDFLESILKDYFVGSLLIWKSGSEAKIGVMPIAGVTDKEDRMEYIILDGQQRITALYYAANSPDFKLKKSARKDYFYINFKNYIDNVEEEIISVFQRKYSKEECYANLLFPFDAIKEYDTWVDGLEDYLWEKLNDKNKVKELRRLIEKKIKHFWEGYEIPYIRLPESVRLDQVTEIFERLNSKGIILSVFDLLIAKFYKDNIDLREIWEETLDKYHNIGSYKKGTTQLAIYILQCISLCYEKNNACARRDILNIHKNILSGSSYSFKALWNEAAMQINNALTKLENLRDGFGVKNQELPYEPIIPILAALMREAEKKGNTPDINSKIKTWYWSAVFSNAYSQSAESQMTLDYKDMLVWLNDDSKIPRTVEKAKNEFTILDIKNIKAKTNAKYKGIMSLVAINGAKDFATDLTLENADFNDKDHIFPHSKYESSISVDSILNITWISKETNRFRKRAQRPSEFVKELLEKRYSNDEDKLKNVMNSHFINGEAYQAMKNEDFDTFIQAREKELKQKIAKVIGAEYEQGSDGSEKPLDVFEMQIRTLILNTLKVKCGDNFWKQCIPGDIQGKVDIKIGKDINIHPYNKDKYNLPEEKVQFLDVMDYSTIITNAKNWEHFKSIFSSKSEVEKHIYSISNYRNALKHVRGMDEVTRKSGEAALIWFKKIFEYIKY